MTMIETIMNGKKGKERLNPFGFKGLVMVLRGAFFVTTGNQEDSRSLLRICTQENCTESSIMDLTQQNRDMRKKR